MKQSRLEERVREIWQEQGFEVTETEKGFDVEKGDESFEVQAFSSENFSMEEAVSKAAAEIVFVDEELSGLAEKLDADVSVLQEHEERDLELPSFEIIGDVAVINELVDLSREEAVEGILQSHPNVETIILKTDSLSGEFRVGSYETLYGEETETVHTEFGCEFLVDPTRVYFSERFSTERKRVVDQIEEGERVLVMFAGVGPFAIMAAKHANPEKVVAVEKNPVAADYMKQNIERNSVEDVVEAYEGDVDDIVPDLDEEFDRVVMPLPGMADQFLETAFNAASDSAIVHYYRFSDQEDRSDIVREVEEISSKAEVSAEVLRAVVCGERGPGVDRVCFDIELRSK